MTNWVRGHQRSLRRIWYRPHKQTFFQPRVLVCSSSYTWTETARTLIVESPEALTTTSPLVLDVTSQIRDVCPPLLPMSPLPKTCKHCPSSTSQTRRVLSLDRREEANQIHFVIQAPSTLCTPKRKHQLHWFVATEVKKQFHLDSPYKAQRYARKIWKKLTIYKTFVDQIVPKWKYSAHKIESKGLTLTLILKRA